jgi:hypothetical protein
MILLYNISRTVGSIEREADQWLIGNGMRQ